MKRSFEPFEPGDGHLHGSVCKSRLYPGVAIRVWGWETEPNDETEWTGYEVRTGRILGWMVGDDTDLAFDPEDLQPIERGAYCGECGQIGCRCDAYDRECEG